MKPRLAAPLLAVWLTACAGPGYYWQAARGHLALMNSRQDIDSYLALPDRDPKLADRLETAVSMLAFAEQQLGLPANGSYQTFALTEGRVVAWNVVATPEFSLEPVRWCFLVSGCISYRGYFKRDKADKLAQRYRDKGHDVAIFGASAYSTLGWFDDPLLDNMLHMNNARLADTLIHELAHQRLYIKGDTNFNESYASFVGRQGADEWLALHGAPGEPQRWREETHARDQFDQLLKVFREELAELYASGADEAVLRARKHAAFDRLRSDYDQLVTQAWNGRDRYGGWFEPPPNNADLAMARAYQGGICAFARLFQQAEGNWADFHARAADLASAEARERSNWIRNACTSGE